MKITQLVIHHVNKQEFKRTNSFNMSETYFDRDSDFENGLSTQF